MEANLTQQLIPVHVFPPGRIISRELAARNWTQEDLAVSMGRSGQLINEIIQGDHQITPDVALDLATAFGTSAEFWTNLASNYQLHLARQHQQIDPIAPQNTMRDLALIAETNNSSSI
jgi:HTH-type transcriptional regulator / antitoxin HigA